MSQWMNVMHVNAGFYTGFSRIVWVLKKVLGKLHIYNGMLIGFLLHYTIIPHDSMMGRQLKKLYLDKGSPTFLAGSVDKLFKAYRANKFF